MLICGGRLGFRRDTALQTHRHLSCPRPFQYRRKGHGPNAQLCAFKDPTRGHLDVQNTHYLLRKQFMSNTVNSLTRMPKTVHVNLGGLYQVLYSFKINSKNKINSKRKMKICSYLEKHTKIRIKVTYSSTPSAAASTASGDPMTDTQAHPTPAASRLTPCASLHSVVTMHGSGHHKSEFSLLYESPI